MAESRTSVAQVRFLVDQEPNGCPFILLDQQVSPALPILREAEEFAALLNSKVHSLVYIGEDPDEASDG